MRNEDIRMAGERKIRTAIEALERRNISACFCEDRREAAEKILSMIPGGASVSCGGSVTLDELGVKDALRERGVDLTDPFEYSDRAESMKARREAFASDVFLTSANAVTMDGLIVNIDGTGNRAAAILFGPEKVIFAVGVNKLVEAGGDAFARIRREACPPNCLRLGKRTPCAATGECGECLVRGETVCCHMLTTRFSSIDDRMHVVFINEDLGF